MRYKRFKDNQKIAKERIEILTKMIKKYPKFGERYKYLIKRIAKKYRISI